MHDSNGYLELACIGGASLIMFDDAFTSNTSSDIDAFLLDLSVFSEQFRYDIDEVSCQTREHANKTDELNNLQYDWLNDEIMNPHLQKDIEPIEFLDYLDYSREKVFCNANGEPVIKLIPADPNIVIMAKILSNRHKDIHVSRYFINMRSLNTILAFHQYFSQCLPHFVQDERYIRALVYVGKFSYAMDIEDIYEFLKEANIHYDQDTVQEYYEHEPWGDQLWSY